MKKKIFFIFVSVLLMIGVTVYMAVSLQKESVKTFTKGGYILNTESADKDDKNASAVKYYFSANTAYKNSLNNTIEFKDTNGDKVKVPEASFVHYDDDSISLLKKGVILNTRDVTSEVPIYYNLFEGTTLEANGNSYQVDNLGKTLKFEEFVVRVSDNKYLIVSNDLKLRLDGKTSTDIKSNYVEVSVIEEGIIKIENQDSSYQTVATNASIMMGPDLRLNLDNGYFFYKDEATINLNSMIIDSDDNVDITPIEDIVPDEIEDDETNAEGQQNPDDPNVIVVEEEAASEEGEAGIVNIEQEVVENELKLPTAALGDVDITANRFSGSITINDPDGVITGKTYTTVVENSNSRVVFDKETDAGIYNIDVYAELLTPETSYSLTTTVHYIKNEIEYTMDVIQQLFVTSSIGISLEKDYYTSSELAFICKIDSYSKVKSADIKLLSSSGEVLKERPITAEEAQNDTGYRVIFSELQSNTKYSVLVENILYEDDVISSEYSIEKSAKTLKSRPSMGTPSFTMDKKSGAFSLKLNNMIDANSGVDSYIYEVYDARTVSDGGQPLMVIEKSNLSSVNVAIDDALIKRGIPYTYKVKAVFYDNEKYIEYTTGYSNNMQMDGVESPTITWETNEDAGGITFESIHGFITVTDTAGTIDYDKPMTIVYTNSIGTSKSYTVSSGNSIIPFDQNNLRANETYTISVYASVNLMDDNGAVDSYHVGSVILKTKSTRALDVFYNVNTDVVTEAFRVYCKLLNVNSADNTLEANTLSELTFVLYEGPSASGTVVKSVRKVDRDVREYVSTLKEDYYDNGFYLNADFFGLRSTDLTAENYTISIQGAKDYTDFQNEIPLTNQTVTVSVNGFVPDPDEDKVWFTNEIIRNKDAGGYNHYDPYLGAETIVGIKVKTTFDNSKKYGKYIVLHVWDVTTSEKYEVTSQMKTVDFKQDGSIDPVYYWFDYGTSSSVDDSTSGILRRGHIYMFSFTAKLDLNNDGLAETDYPATTTKVLKSDNFNIDKQRPTIYVYPSSSTSTSIEMKYSLRDPDKCLYSDSLTANIYDDAGVVLKTSTKAIEVTDTDPEFAHFRKVNFTGLVPGLLKVSANIAPYKNGGYSTYEYTNQYFEQEYTLPTINYSLMVDVNRILISINNYDDLSDAIKHIVALKLTFTCEGRSIVKDFVRLNGDNAVVDMYDLGDFINKDITLSVQAYYDTDLVGWDQTADYFALQAIKDVYGGGEYFTLNSNSVFVESNIASGSAFTNQFYSGSSTYVLQQQSNSITEGPTFTFTATSSNKGIRANGTYFNLKKIALKPLNSTTATFSFNQIIPGINLENEDGVLQIAPSIQTVKFDAIVYGFGSSSIRDSKIYVQVSKTDDSGSYLERDGDPHEFTIDQINYQVCEIDGLLPKQNYALEFFAYIDNGSGGWEYKKLYDLADNSDQRIYYFKTLTGINIDNIRYYYLASSYDDKNIRIRYDVDRIMGYDRIEYKMYKQITNPITGLPDWEEVDVEIPDDVGFRNSMTKYISCNPGSIFDFGSVYKITITPFVDLTIGGEEVHIPLDQQNGELRFNLRSLHVPLVGVTSSVGTSTDESASLEFKVNIYDTDKVIVGGKYSIYVDDEDGNDVTPAEYATQSYTISTTNRSFVVDNLVEGKTYFFHVVYQRDITNKGPDYYEDINYRYKANALNNEAVSVGSISATANSSSNNQIDLNFSYSQNITEIDNLRYSIYNSLNGTSFDNDIEFTLNRKTISGTTIYSITLPEYLSSAGIYYLQLQFIADDEVIEEQTVEYSYFG